MKKLILFSICLIMAEAILAQQGEQHLVEPKGNYKSIDLSADNKLATQLIDKNNPNRNELIKTIENDPNIYTPPVLYVLSGVLVDENRFEDAEYWYYLAQLRARYDVNRCTDKTANASEYNSTFGEAINPRAMKDPDKLGNIIKKVVDYVRNNEERYDQRWINLSGMDAMTQSLGGKAKTKELSEPKEKWAAIKAKTIDDYYNGFVEYVLKKKN